MSEFTKRVAYVDIAKGIGMMTVIWGHIRETGLSNAAIYAFHMPLFFFMAGMMFKQEKYTGIGLLLKKRLQTLLIPYLLFSIGAWIVWAGYNFLQGNTIASYWMPLLQTFISQGSGGYLVHNSPLWFVTCLFAVEVIYYFTSKFKPGINVVLCVLLVIAGNFMRQEGSMFRYLPWSMDMAFCAIPFYAAGNLIFRKFSHQLFCQKINTHKVLAWISMLLLMAIVVVCAKYNGPVSMGHRILGNVFIFYPAAYMGTFSILILSVLLAGFSAKIIAGIQWFGEHSFFVMATQTPVKGIILVIMSKLMHKRVGALSNSTLYSMPAFIIAMICEILVVAVIVKAVAVYQKLLAKVA